MQVHVPWCGSGDVSWLSQRCRVAAKLVGDSVKTSTHQLNIPLEFSVLQRVLLWGPRVFYVIIKISSANLIMFFKNKG